MANPSELATTGFAQPADVPVCVENKAAFDAMTRCAQVSRAQRESYKLLFDATYLPTERALLELECQHSLDSLRLALALTDACKLPSHEAYLAAASPPEGSGAGAGSGAGSGSGSSAPESEVSTAPADSIWFSEPLPLAGGRNLELALAANSLSNDWVFISADLVESTTGSVVSGEAAIEHYAGIEDGESWSEGNSSSSTVFGPQPAGTYILRLEAQHGSAGLMPINVTLKQGVFRGKWLAWAMLILGIPLFIVGLTSYFHEKKRWENSTAGKAPFTPVALLILAVVGIFVAIGAIVKALLSSSSSDD